MRRPVAIGRSTDGKPHAQGAVAAAGPQIASPLPGMEEKTLVGNALRVVVVDDLVDAAETLADLLRLDGCEVRTAGDGCAAMELVRDFVPDCVLLDVDMPRMDGSELARQVRELHGNSIVLIAITGWDPADQRVATAFERVDHYLSKPINPETLRKMLNRTRH
jgi:DNA-binding response OmpR family regulator